MFQIYIINRPYYNAGKKFGWEGPSSGLGISVDKLEGTGDIMVKVKGRTEIYSIDKREAIELAEKYQSFTEFNIKNGRVRLAVIPWGNFKIIENENDTSQHSASETTTEASN